MSAEFVTRTSLRKGASDPQDADDAVRRFRKFARSPRTDAPFTIHHGDGKQSRELTTGETVARLEALTRSVPVGARLVVESADHELFKLHAIESKLEPVTDVPGTEFVRLWIATLRERWPNARLAGTCVCKDDGTGKHNGHENCAACDHFDSWPNMIASYRYFIANAEKIGGSYTILGAPGAPQGPRIWTFGEPRTYTSRGERLYGGEPHYHQHASFDDGPAYAIACRSSSTWPRG